MSMTQSPVPWLLPRWVPALPRPQPGPCRVRQGQPRQPRTAQLLLQPRLPPERRARVNADEWAQGFLLRLESGFSEGTVGFGVDAIGLLGFKLDSGGGRGGTGRCRPTAPPAAPRMTTPSSAWTAKARVSNSLLKVGALTSRCPLVSASDTRLLPELFRRARCLDVQEIDGLTHARRALDSNKLNSSSDYRGERQRQPASAGAAMPSTSPAATTPDPGADRQPSTRVPLRQATLYRQHLRSAWYTPSTIGDSVR
ncbi:OprD family outer membrane porin [Pseudomonas aeruginosa]